MLWCLSLYVCKKFLWFSFFLFFVAQLALAFSPAVFVSGGVAVFGTFSICPVLVLPFFAGPDRAIFS